MQKIIFLLFTLVLFSYSSVALAASSYETGSIVGKIFIAVLIFLIVKKYVFKK